MLRLNKVKTSPPGKNKFKIFQRQSAQMGKDKLLNLSSPSFNIELNFYFNNALNMFLIPVILMYKIKKYKVQRINVELTTL